MFFQFPWRLALKSGIGSWDWWRKVVVIVWTKVSCNSPLCYGLDKGRVVKLLRWGVFLFEQILLNCSAELIGKGVGGSWVNYWEYWIISLNNINCVIYIYEFGTWNDWRMLKKKFNFFQKFFRSLALFRSSFLPDLIPCEESYDKTKNIISSKHSYIKLYPISNYPHPNP